ncbi:MAG TPA: GAF domain-containing sensor histidine kinase [Vicinamibacterales bacterium]|nr:GAF domain-containing sensor histidine kinase [Vicinamibacterales bacterium]
MNEAPGSRSPIAPSDAASRRRTLSDQELVQSLDWLILMRWLAGSGVLVGTFVATALLRLTVPALALYVTGLAILGYNAAFFTRLRALRQAPPPSMTTYEMFAREQIAVDWLGMIVLVALSGGIESPAIVFFTFHIAIAALLLPHARGFAFVSLPPVLVGLVAVLGYLDVLPAAQLFRTSHRTDPVYIASVLFFFTSACYVLSYFCMRIARRLRRRENEISGLYESVRDTTSSLDLETVLDRFVESATRVLDCKGAAIRLLDPTRSRVTFAAAYGLSREYLETVPVEYDRAHLDQATMLGGAVFVNDALGDPRIWKPERLLKEGIASMLSVPLLGKTGVLGVLRAYGGEGHRFTDQDASFLQLVAAHGVVAIENAQAYQMLGDLNQEKSRFARVTTHELRAPAQVTESLLTALADGYAGPLSDPQRELVDRARRRLHSLQSLVDDLLGLAAGKANLREGEQRPVALNALAADVCARFEAGAREKGLALSLRVPSQALFVWSDPADIDRLVTNLLSNAVKYTNSGSVAVELTAEGGDARLVVRDTGIGIPPGALSHVFDEFYRANNARAVSEAGTGLGLAIVKDLVKRYEGNITVQSREGEGTTFLVTLPLMASAAAPVTPDAERLAATR